MAANASIIGWMTAAELIAPTIMKPVDWVEICDRYPNEWVCLVDVEHQTDGLIRSARVVGHHRSLKAALQQVDSWSPTRVVAYAHTGGYRRRRLRIEMTDEIRDIVRARR
jgi:hypothetical protein